MSVHDRLIAAVASIRAYVVLGSLATTHAVLVTVLAHTVVVILGGRAFGHAERAVASVFAFCAVLRVRSRARTVALVVAQLAGLLVRSVNSWRGAVLKTIVPQNEVLAGETLRRTGSPTTLVGTLFVAYQSIFYAFALVPIVRQQTLVLRGLLDPRPIDTLRVTEILVLQDGDGARVDFLQRAEPERDQRRLHDVQRREILGQGSSSDHLEVPEVRQISEVLVIALDVQETGDLLQSAEHLQLVGMHFLVTFAETEVLIDVLETLETLVEDRDRALDDRAVLEAVYVPGVDLLDALAGFRARSVAGHAFAV